MKLLLIVLINTPIHTPINTPISRPSFVKEAVETNLEALKADFAAFKAVLLNPQAGEAWGSRRIEYDFDSVVAKLEAIQAPLSTTWGIVGHLMGVSNSEDLRKAHDEMMPKVIEFNQKMGQSQPLFKAISALKKRLSVWGQLSEAQKRIVDASIKQMESAGVGLEPAEREKFNKLQLEVAELGTKYTNNVLDSTKAFKLRIDKAEEIEGLPESIKSLAASNAVANGEEKATASEGPWLLTLDMPVYLPSMQHLKSRALRETLYRAYVSRASSGETDNAPLITRILQIKQELAQMLGYSTFAEKSLSTKMAPSVDAVKQLTTMLREKSIESAKKELEDLKTFAAAEGFTEPLQIW